MNTPRFINLELTSHCPASCEMCPRDQIKELGHMPLSLVKKIAEKAKNAPIFEISLAGRGEPTVYPYLEEALKILSTANIPLSLVTTGVAMTPEITELCNKYITNLKLSVSSIDESIFKKVHCGLDYTTVWNNIEHLTNVMKDKVIVHLVGGEVIFDKLGETSEYFINKGIKNLLVFPRWNRIGNVTNQKEKEQRAAIIKKYNIQSSEQQYHHIYGDSMDELMAKIMAKKIDNPDYCPVSDVGLSINFMGQLPGCFQDFGYETIIGNIQDDEISDLMNKRNKILGRMSICKNCNSKDVAILTA